MTVDRVAKQLGSGPHLDLNAFMEAIENAARRHSVLEQENEGLLGEILGTGKGS